MKQNNTSEKKKGGFKGFLKSRAARRGAMAVLVTALFVAAVILVNVIVNVLAGSTTLSLDVTANASYRLQQDTIDYTATVTKPVDIYVLQKEADFESGDSNNYKYYVQANKLLHAIDDSSDKISLHYKDIVANPTFTADYPDIDWSKNHMLLVVSGKQYRALDLTDLFTFDQEQLYYNGYYIITEQHVEQAVATAVMNVTSEDKTKIMLLSGQGEQDMTAFTTLLQNNAYEVETVSLLNSEIPKDAELIVIYDPDVDISDNIYDQLSAWLKNDGNYGHHLVYFPNDQHPVSEYPNLNSLMETFGMKVTDGYIYENADDHLIPGYNHYFSIFDYAEDAEKYTKNLRNPSIPVVMSLTVPVTVTDSNLASPLLQSSESAFFFPKDLDEESAKDFKPEPETLNGAAIGTMGEGSDDAESSTLTVIGSYDAVTANYIGSSSYNNAAYFVNLFNTLSQRDDMSIVIEGKDPSANSLGLTSVSEIAFPAIIVRFVIPIAVVLIGLIIWIRRRHR